METVEEYYNSGTVDDRDIEGIDDGDILKIDSDVYIRDDGCMSNCVGSTFQFELRNVKTDFKTTVVVPCGKGIRPSDVMRSMNATELEYISSRKYTGEKFIREQKKGLKFGSRITYLATDEHIISKVEYNKVGLISLRNGNRWSSNIEVNDMMNLTFDDMVSLIGKSYINKFKVSKV